MRKRSARSTIKPVTGSASNSCRALIRVDGSAIRRKLKKDYEKALRDLERTRQQIDHFKAEDLPKFTRWLNSTFGALLTELRETARRIQEHERLLFEIEQEIFFTGTTDGRAYARVMERRNHTNAAQDADARQACPDDERKGRSKNQQNDFEPSDEELDEMEELLSDFLGIPRPPRRPAPRPREPENKTARLKDLYRALARLLHPDAQKEMTPLKLERWHQAQAAYAKGDVEQLEVILTLCEIDEKGTTDHTSASLLQRITRQLRSSLAQLRAELRRHRSDPAWGFSKRTSVYPLEVQLRRQLDQDLQRLREDARHLEATVAHYAAKAQRMRQRKKSRTTRRRTGPDNPEFIL